MVTLTLADGDFSGSGFYLSSFVDGLRICSWLSLFEPSSPSGSLADDLFVRFVSFFSPSSAELVAATPSPVFRVLA